MATCAALKNCFPMLQFHNRTFPGTLLRIPRGRSIFAAALYLPRGEHIPVGSKLITADATASVPAQPRVLSGMRQEVL